MSEPLTKRPPFRHVLPGEHAHQGVLFFGFTSADTLAKVREFKVRQDDVFVVTYPKAGTTWMQEITWLLVNGVDFARARETPVYLRSPFLEFKDEVLKEDGLELAEDMTSPRVIKTHLQAKMAPEEIFEKNAKVVLLFRNPKDVCVSYFNFYKSSSSFGEFNGQWADFLDMFQSGHVDHGSWQDFTNSWWPYRTQDNVHLVYFEDLKKDPLGQIRELASFLGCTQLDDVTLSQVAAHCSFDQMRSNPMTNHLDVYSIDSSVSPLLRKGQVGDWKNYLTVGQNEAFDRWLGGMDIPFQYQLD